MFMGIGGKVKFELEGRRKGNYCKVKIFWDGGGGKCGVVLGRIRI